MPEFLHLLWKLVDSVGYIDDEPALEAAAAIRPLLEKLEADGRLDCGEYVISITRKGTPQ